ncbi:MAG: formyltetrahydrofolate deformylase [Spirochaetales bacterium]|nr:formyltetrahydrofolate deformylase [Spirochaetales bacterium]
MKFLKPPQLEITIMNKIIFLIHCPDQKGLMANITGFFYDKHFNILDCQQHTDTEQKKYFMRISVDMNDLQTSREALKKDFSEFAVSYNLSWSVHFTDQIPRAAVMVSKTSHCLYDLIFRQKEGDIVCDIPLIISNHPDLEYAAEQFKIPYYCLPVTKGKKAEQEQKVLELLRKHHIDLVIMARYMQILSKDFIDAYPERIINIHHAFLPAFQGANPYRRAYERGVKMIGATAHYATEDLDQGPIIEQDVIRVNHELSQNGLKKVGKDVERIVLSRAVQAHLEHRVIAWGNRTIVFSSEK